MNTLNKFFFLLIFISGLFITSCVDNDFDEPENTLVINDSEVMTIAEVLELLPATGGVVFGEGNIGLETKYIKGTVTADDASGNFFKTITFQDATDALSIAADRNELNAEFPEGNVIYVRLNGLTLGKDADLPRIGYSIEDDRLQRIPDLLVNDFMIAGGPGDVIEPTDVTISELQQNTNLYYNKLISISQAQFTLGYVGQTYADADNVDGPQTVNTMLEDCDGDEIILRNSGYADFAREIIPNGSGKVTAIASVFLDDLQLFIRDLDDVEFTELRCDGSGGSVDNELTIGSIKERYYTLGTDEAEVGFITGTVISDRNNITFQSRNVVIQNGNDGIVVRFTNDHSFAVGTKLKINVAGQELSEFNDLLQISNVPNFNAEATGNTTLPTPREVTIDELLLNFNDFESTLVKIIGAEFTSGSTYGDSPNLDDGTESIQLFTKFTASFANNPLPSGTINVTAVAGQFNNPQLVINSPSDIEGGMIDPGGDSEFEEGFVGEFREPIQLSGWMNIAVKGDRQWYYSDYQDENFAECEGYQDPSPETEAWLITPTIDTDDASLFSFETQKAFWQHQGLSVWISPDFTDFANATWTEVSGAKIADNSGEDFTWVPSGQVDLKDYLTGKVRVAFKYEGTSASNTTKMRLDNVILK